MPKSKRAKVVNLTKVKKKDREWKGALIEKAHKLCEDYADVYVFKHRNMRNDCFKELREDHKGSTAFMMASTKKIQAALGRTPEEEHRTGSHKLVPHLRGFAGLMFTNLPRAEVETIVREFEHEDYARAGSRATETVQLPEGPLQGPHGVPFPHTMEHGLRAHGLPTKLNKGVIELTTAHTVCTTGKKLNAHQAALLRHLDIKMAVASLRLAAAIDKEGNFREYEHDASWSDQDDTAELGFDDGLPDSMMLPAILPQH